MQRLGILLLATLAATTAETVRADIYKEVAADGTVTFTNIYREGMQRVALGRPPAPAARSQRQQLQPLQLSGPSQQPPLPQHPQARTSASFASLIARAAVEHGLPEALLHAVIHAESNYDPQAQSPRGAAGLMQLMPDTARELGVENVWDPAANIRGGARYLKRLLQMFDNELPLALAAYNAGPGAVSRWGRAIPPYEETQRYVPKVLAHYQRLQEAERGAAR